MLLAMSPVERILRLQPEYPAGLRDIKRWPAELQLLGKLQHQGPSVAIVGARAASAEGMAVAHRLAAELAQEGYSIVSGGALGVDSAAHRGALSVGGHTVAVMACGLDRLYPQRNKRLFAGIVESGGAVVSPFAEGAEPKPFHFVQRNEVIAALADAVVVVEAGLGSGSLHTARYALRLGRLLASYPGSPGCEALLSKATPMVTSARELIELRAGKLRLKPTGARPAPGTPEAQVLAKLRPRKAQSASVLARSSGLPLRQTQRILSKLELQSLVLVRPGQRYVCSPLARLKEST